MLRPGGRLLFVDELTPDRRKPPSERAGLASPATWTEADTRRMLGDAGFADLAIRYKGVWRLADKPDVSCHKPAASRPNPFAEQEVAAAGAISSG